MRNPKKIGLGLESADPELENGNPLESTWSLHGSRGVIPFARVLQQGLGKSADPSIPGKKNLCSNPLITFCNFSS